MASSFEALLRGIGSRREGYSSAVRSQSPEEGVPYPQKENLSNKQFLKTIRDVYTLLKDIPDSEAEQKKVYLNIQNIIFSRMVDLQVLIEDEEALGVLPEDSEYLLLDHIKNEYEILSYIFGSNLENREEVIETLDDVILEEATSLLEADDSSSPPENPVDSERLASPELEPKEYPNDFFAFLAANGVESSILLGRPPEGADSEEKEEYLKEKYSFIGDVYVSLILNKMMDRLEQRLVNLEAPDLAAFGPGNFPGKKSSNTYPSSIDLLIQIQYGLQNTSRSDEYPHAMSVLSRLDKVIGSFSGISKVSDNYKKSMSSLEGLSSFATPLPSSDSEKIPTWYDSEFWSAMLTLSDAEWNSILQGGSGKVPGMEGAAALHETHYVYKIDENDPNYDPGNPSKNWKESTLSFGEMFLQSHHELKETARFPHQRKFANLRKERLVRFLSSYPRSISPGTRFLVSREGGRSHYKVKGVVEQVSNGDGSAFPYLAEQPENKDRRVKTVRQLTDRLSANTKEYVPTLFATINAANTLHSWLTADSLGAQVPRYVLESNIKSWDNGRSISESDLVWYFTVKDQSVDFGPDGLALEGYNVKTVVTGLSRAQVDSYKGKLNPYVLGVTWAEKAASLQAYASKSISTPDSQESQFQAKAIGTVKTFVYSYDSYFVHWQSGYTVGELFEELSRKDGASPLGSRNEISSMIAEALGTNPSQSWALHLKDAFSLTKTFMGGSKALEAPVNIAKVNIELNKIEDLQESFVSSARSTGRQIDAYYRDRDNTVPSKVQKEFFANPEKFPNMGRVASVVQILDSKGNPLTQKLTRLANSLHLTPQDFLMTLDPETIEKGDFYSKLEQKFGNVSIPTFTIKLADHTKAYGYEEESRKWKTATPSEKAKMESEFFSKYLRKLEMRHLLFRVFYYAITQGDDWKNLGWGKVLLFGMMYSPEMRKKFENNAYTRGSLERTGIDFAKHQSAILNFFGEEFGHNEVPDMAASDLLSERMFMKLLYDMGYISNLSDDFGKVMSEAVKDLFKK